MATASIVSSVTAPVAKGSVVGASREDLAVNDVVLLDSVNTGSYSWSLAYAPPGSAAAFSGSAVNKSPGSFTVDVEGSYLIRLQFTDGTGVTEQFVRLRALTTLGSLKLPAAGERVDTVNVPVDATAAGWADDQNTNLSTILSLISGMIRGVSQETHAAASFAFGGGVSSVVLADTPDTGTNIQGLIIVYRDGLAVMDNTGPALPTTATEYRIDGDRLEIGADITASGYTYRVIYPSVP